MVEELLGRTTESDFLAACKEVGLSRIDEHRMLFLKTPKSIDVEACPGSGKTTLVVAKLAALASTWTSRTRGICVLSHTNVAKDEIIARLRATKHGGRLLSYPHYIDTIHGWAGRFLAIPWLRSRGHQVTAIDDVRTHAVRRRALTPGERISLESFLKRKFKSLDDLRVVSTSMEIGFNSGPFPAGTSSDSYKSAAKAVSHSVNQGYYCFDEILLFASALISQCDGLDRAFCHRFPLVFLDEMQDTLETQSALLRNFFNREQTCVQRLGDSNQGIFDSASKPTEDKFPDPNSLLVIDNSHRFGSKIAALACPFAVTALPGGLKGLGPQFVKESEGKHAIFIYPEGNVSGVLDAFGKHILEHLPDTLIAKGAVCAIGAVHAPAAEVGVDHAHYPKTVSHYYPHYQPELSKSQAPRPTLSQVVLQAQCDARSNTTFASSVNALVAGIVHLANLTAPTDLARRPRDYAQLRQIIAGSSAGAIASLDALFSQLLVQGKSITEDDWPTLVTELMNFANILNSCPQPQPITEFLAWRVLAIPNGRDELISGNIVKVSSNGRNLDIRLGSIHSVKGETHLATLVLETFNHKHWVASLLPWLTGVKANGQGVVGRDRDRLFTAYVAMTRATHLLCLALCQRDLGKDKECEKRLEQLSSRGWSIIHIS